MTTKEWFKYIAILLIWKGGWIALAGWSAKSDNTKLLICSIIWFFGGGTFLPEGTNRERIGAVIITSIAIFWALFK